MIYGENPQRPHPNILIADDHPDSVNVLRETLKQCGYEPRIVTDGGWALEAVYVDPPDLILLDVEMPVLNGYEVCRKLKADESYKNIPIIFLSGHREVEERVMGFSAGGVDYITKPYEFEEVQARIGTHLAIVEQQRLIDRQNEELNHLLRTLGHDLMNVFTPLKLYNIKAEKVIPTDWKSWLVENRKIIVHGIDIIKVALDLQQSNDKRLPLESVSLVEVINDCETMLRNQLLAKSITLNRSADPSLTVQAERCTLVNSVLNNILTNAIKFSDPASTIDVNAYQSSGQVYLSVKDTGIGIPNEILRHLFDIKMSTSRHGTKGEIGTGFGMPIMKRFVEMYGGKIEVRSKDIGSSPSDHGTEIVISFLPAV